MGEDPRDTEAVFFDALASGPCKRSAYADTGFAVDGQKEEPNDLRSERNGQKSEVAANYLFFIPPEIYPFELTTKEYDEDTIFSDDFIDIRFFQNETSVPRVLEAARRKNITMKSNRSLMAWLSGWTAKKIVLSGDLLNSDDLISVLPGADLVVHEFGHIKPDLLRNFAKDYKIPKLLINHVHHEWDTRDQELKETVSADFPGEVQVAHDLWRFPL